MLEDKIDFKLFFEIFRNKVQVSRHSPVTSNLKDKFLLILRSLLTRLIESRVGWTKNFQLVLTESRPSRYSRIK